MENVVADLRFAVRALRHAPSFALATILTMALGIGASTAIFTVVDAVLLRPLPVPHPEDFTYVGWVWQKGGDIPALTALQYEFVREHNHAFAAVATYGTREVRVGASAGATAPAGGLAVNGDFFGTVGFTPSLGRVFDVDELEKGDATVVILGDAVWRTQFGGDPAILGRRVVLDREPRTVVGVMPPEFFFPPAVKNLGFLVPVALRVNPTDEGHNTEMIARLRHGTSESVRDADVSVVERRRSGPRIRRSQARATTSSSSRIATSTSAMFGARSGSCSEPCGSCYSSPARTRPRCSSCAPRHGSARSPCEPRSARAPPGFCSSFSPKASCSRQSRPRSACCWAPSASARFFRRRRSRCRGGCRRTRRARARLRRRDLSGHRRGLRFGGRGAVVPLAAAIRPFGGCARRHRRRNAHA